MIKVTKVETPRYSIEGLTAGDIGYIITALLNSPGSGPHSRALADELQRGILNADGRL